MEARHELAQELLNIKAVQMRTENYFTWTSGIKSPIYCDNRLTMSYPEVRRKVAEAFVELINEMEVKPDIIAGCATAGIPHAAWIAEQLDLPMVYVRSKPKGHGKGNQIEGHILEGQKAVVIEDLISTGGSSIEATEALKQKGVEVLEVLAIFTYGLKKAANNFDAAGLKCRTITDYDTVLSLLASNGQINESEKVTLEKWRDDL
ncbi:orotate phosphoribosyltransferase [Virgibacillus kekensis]|uniref:Orotate phosphoribosyltransferase n=1 Tax=Virgibacillus kekensis TaxID=202261 RepID=A0ABV9DEA5_9BACI